MSQPEARLSRSVVDYLTACGAFAVKLHGGSRQRAGLPDIHATWRGYSIWIEMKVRSSYSANEEPCSPRQLKCHTDIMRAGGHVLVAWSLAEVKDWFTAFREAHCA